METTVPSYLTARRTKDQIRARHQEITKEVWDNHRHRFDLFVSQFVIDEAGGGDPKAAAARLDSLRTLPLLDITDDVEALADGLIEGLALPAKAVTDAAHIAIASVHGMDYLLTWNCSHIANSEMISKIERVCFNFGYNCPKICTPEEMMGI